jgi:hypothetical protein
MATRILEYVANDPSSIGEPVVPLENVQQPALTTSTTPTNSAAFDARTNLICVQSDEAVYVKRGANPTATTDSYRIQAGQEQFFAVPVGQGWKVSVRQ